MGDWSLYDTPAGPPVRTGMDEDEARNLVDVNIADGQTGVYALGPGGVRYPEQ